MANKTIIQLPAAAAAVLTQLLETVTNPSGTPVSEKLTLAQVLALAHVTIVSGTQVQFGASSPNNCLDCNLGAGGPALIDNVGNIQLQVTPGHVDTVDLRTPTLEVSNLATLFNLGFGAGNSSSSYPFCYSTGALGAIGIYNFNGPGSTGGGEDISRFSFHSNDTGISNETGYMRFGEIGGNFIVRIGSVGLAGDALVVDCTTGDVTVTGSLNVGGKVTASGGIDPPYVLYDERTRAQTKQRVDKEVPTAKKAGAAVFWNPDSNRLECYVASRNKFYDMAGNELV